MKPTLAMTLLVGLVFGQSEPPAFKPEWSVVLPPNSMANGRFWCSRSGPALTGYWRPDPAIIRELEVALAPALRLALERASGGRSAPPGVDEFYRQYIGIRANGRRAVYVNGFHQRHLVITAESRPESVSFWLTRAVNVCDGGTMFFGAEYDPATRTVGNIEFNVWGVPTQSAIRNRQSPIGNPQSAIRQSAIRNRKSANRQLPIANRQFATPLSALIPGRPTPLGEPATTPQDMRQLRATQRPRRA